jgi:hypothetical protein
MTSIILLSLAGIMNKIANKDRWYFYSLSNLVIQITNKNELYQQARNLSEELFLLCIKEKMPVYGYYIQFNCYARQNNIQDSLYYFIGFCSLFKFDIPKELWISMLETLQILFRNQKNEKMQNELYLLILDKYKNDLSQRNILQVNMCNYASKFATSSIDIEDLESFLNTNRELIFRDGLESIRNWYVFLQQVLKIYKSEMLSIYLGYFEKCLPEDVRQASEELLGYIKDFKPRYNELFSRLTKTLYHKDMVSEISSQRVFLNQLLQNSITKGDFKAFLNAFRLLCDLELNNNEQTKEGLVENTYSNTDESINYYDSLPEFIIDRHLSGTEVVFLARKEQELACFSICNSEKRGPFVNKSWIYNNMRKVLDNLFKIIEFNIDDYDYESEFNKFEHQKQYFIPFNIETISEYPLSILFDVDTSPFPFNLITHNNDFLFLKQPIHSLLKISDLKLDTSLQLRDNSIALWCPTESGDLTLNQLYCNLEKTINKFNIKTSCKVEIENEELSGDIKIIIAHGGSDIDNYGIISAKDHFNGIRYSYQHIEKILVNTSLVILFVCYSGKMSVDLFYNKTNTLLKKINKNGTKVIIAPRWPLNILVPPLWLPVFLEELKNGSNALESFHKANLKVYEIYPNCGAWGCLHYYGLSNIYAKVP